MSISFFVSHEKTIDTGGYRVGQNGKKNFGKLVTIERKIDVQAEKGMLGAVEEICLQNICSSIRSWLYISLSDKHRLKGVLLYESMEQIRQGVIEMRNYKEHSILEELDKQLENSINGLKTQYEALKQGQDILRQLTDILYGEKDDKGNRSTQSHKEQNSSQAIKKQVEFLLNNAHEQYKTHSPEMREYLKHFSTTYLGWAPNLYTCYDFPKIPNDNNQLELSHSQMKKQYRRITGKSSTAQYLRIHGEQAAYMIAYAHGNNSQEELEFLIRNTDNVKLQKQKQQQLMKSQHRGKFIATKRKLTKMLQDNTLKWKKNFDFP